MTVKHASSLLLVMVWVAACGGSSPSSPTPAIPVVPSTPPRWALSGTVVETGTQSIVGAARVDILDGANQGRTAPADGQGRYRFDNLEPGAFAIRVTADGFEPETRSVTLTSNQVADFTLTRSTPTRGVFGRAIDAVSDLPLAGVMVRLDGLGETTTGADGTFRFDASDPQQVRGVSVSSPVIVERSTRLRVPGPDTTLSLMPVSLDLRAFDEMFRPSGVLHRWTVAPRVVVQSQVLQFTNVSDAEYTALASTMSDSEVSGLLADFGWALPQLTGGAFSAVAEERRESAAAGERVRVSRPGLIVVARYEGLTAATGFWGYSRWAWNGAGEMQAGIIMLDRGFETSGSVFRRSLRAHEFGHALGYTHVTVRESVMNSSARFEPNTFDRAAAKFAFQRPPLNRTPDIDPDPFTSNFRAFAELIWSKGMP
jgi:carboxypeptidase family protein